MREFIAEKYANSLYHYQPDILVARWWIPGYPILIGGSLIDAADFQHLARTFNVTHVVNVETEHDDTGKCPSDSLLQIRVADDGAAIPLDYIRQLKDFVGNALPACGVFYVHCQMGGSRSPAFAYAILRLHFRLNREQALSTINAGFSAKKAESGLGEAQAESVYGWHPVHQGYLASVDAAVDSLLRV